MTPERLKELNRLQRNVEELEQVLRCHRDGNPTFTEQTASPDSVKRARKILADDLEAQIVAAKALFAAADAPPAAKSTHRDAQLIKRLREVAELIESDGVYISAFSTSLGHGSTEIEFRVRWHEKVALSPAWFRP